MKNVKGFSKIVGVTLLVVLVALAVLTYWHPGARTTLNGNHPNAVNRRKVVRVVALGDSLTQGVGDQQKKGGYTERLQTMIHRRDHVKVDMHNYGKSGDRSDQIEARLVKSKAMQQQVKRSQAIVMTVGGNDLLQTLTKNATINQQSQLNTQLDSAKMTYQKKLRELLDTVRHYNPRAPIFLYSIYNPVYVYFANIDQLTDAVDGWNAATKQTAGQYKALYWIDINRALSVGQFKSATQQAQLKRQSQDVNDGKISTKTFQATILASDASDELNHYLSPVDHFHPNAKGYRLMTRYAFNEMQDHQQWLLK